VVEWSGFVPRIQGPKPRMRGTSRAENLDSGASPAALFQKFQVNVVVWRHRDFQCSTVYGTMSCGLEALSSKDSKLCSYPISSCVTLLNLLLSGFCCH